MKPKPTFRVSVRLGRDLWTVPLMARYDGRSKVAYRIVCDSPIWRGALVRKADVHLIRAGLGKPVFKRG